MRRGLGLGINRWGGAGQASSAKANIHPDGWVEVELGSQGRGTGTRTIVAQVTAESMACPSKPSR